MARLIDVEDVDLLVADLRNYQDSALIVSIFCGLNKEEISNLKIENIDEPSGVIDLGSRKIELDDIDNDLDLTVMLKLAHGQEFYIENNGISSPGDKIIRHALDVSDKLIFKGIDEKSIDNKLKDIAVWFDAEEFLTYDNLRDSGRLAKAVDK